MPALDRQDEVWAFRLDGPPSKHINWRVRNPAILLSDEAAERAPTAFDDDPEVSLLWACMWICGIAYVTRIAMCTIHSLLAVGDLLSDILRAWRV